MTINQLIALFQNIGDNHFFIKTTEFGDVPSKAEANIENTTYPAFYQVLQSTTNLSNTIERTFTLIVCDLVYPGKENLNEVLSDTEQTLTDIIKILRQESDYYDVIGDPVITPFKDRYGDAVAGHEATVTIQTDYNDGFCDIPSFTFGYPGQTGSSGIPIPPAFDCDTLSSCSVIQGIQTDITTLFSDSIFTANNGLTKTLNDVQLGGTLTQNTTISGASTYNFFLDARRISISSLISSGMSTDDSYFATNTNAAFAGTSPDGGLTEVNFVLSKVGQSITNNGSNNNFTITDSVSNKGILYAADYSANFTFESLVSKRYVDNAITANSPTLTSTQIAFGSGANAITSSPNFYYDDVNSILNTININATSVTAPTFTGMLNGTALLGYADYLAFGAPAQPTFEYVRMYALASKQLSIKGAGNNFAATLLFNGISASRNYTFPNATGTVALTSDITSALASYLTIASAAATYVPYTGATTAVNLNTQTLTSGVHTVNAGTIPGGIVLRDRTSDATAATIYMSQTTPAANNYTLLSSTNTTVLNGPAVTTIAVAGTAIVTLRGVTTGTSNAWFVGQQLTSTNLPASIEATGVLWANNSKQFATGTIATQREFYITPITYTAVAASTITNAYSLYIDAPIASTNMTITNRYALGIAGNMLLATNNSGIFGNDSTSTRRQLLDFSGDNIRIIGVPGTTDIYLTPGTGGLGMIVKGNGGAVGINQGSPTAYLDLPASIAGRATLRIRTGVAPTTPNDGDIWQDGTDIKIRIGGVTKTFTLV